MSLQYLTMGAQDEHPRNTIEHCRGDSSSHHRLRFLRVLETIVERSRQNLSGVWCVLVVRNGEQGYLDVLVESANAEFVPDRTLAISWSGCAER